MVKQGWGVNTKMKAVCSLGGEKKVKFENVTA